MSKCKTKFGTAKQIPASQINGKPEECSTSEASRRLTLVGAKRVRVAPFEGDLIHARMKLSFNEILKTLPLNDFDRETLELERGCLAERCEQATQTLMFTGKLSDLRICVRRKAKLAVIDVMLSAEVAGLIQASLRHAED